MSLTERWVATRKGFKPRDVEEFIDFHWHRPLAGMLVQLIRDWPITPNQVTALSGVMSVLSGVALGLGYFEPQWCIGGGVFLFLSVIFDCADGQLARVRGTFSELGRALDGLVDGLAPLAVFHGMAFCLVGQQYPHAYIWPIGWAAALSLIWHAVSYDATKNIYLHASRPDFSLGGDTIIAPETMQRRVEQLREQGRRGDAMLMWIWWLWTGPQGNQLRPWMSRERTPETEQERELFRSLFRPLMRASTWLGFGTHLFLLSSASLIAAFDARAIWVAWAVILGPLNLVALYVMAARPSRERLFVEGLAEMRSANAATQPVGS